MGTYWYIDDQEEGSVPVYEDDYVAALYWAAKRQGVKITDKMILEELERMWQEERKHGKR